jgi:hypothetical protein
MRMRMVLPIFGGNDWCVCMIVRVCMCVCVRARQGEGVLCGVCVC